MEYEHILGATDFSPLGNQALQRAANLAAEAGCRLTALTVLPQPEMPSPLLAHYDLEKNDAKEAQARIAAREALLEAIPASVREGELQIECEVLVGDPAGEILSADLRLRPDLIVLATHGRRGWRRWIMGSVAERVVQMAHADVLTVRERGTEADAPEEG